MLVASDNLNLIVQDVLGADGNLAVVEVVERLGLLDSAVIASHRGGQVAELLEPLAGAVLLEKANFTVCHRLSPFDDGEGWR
jgi:hypothetical protein